MTTATLARISRPAKPLPVTRDQVAIMIDRLSVLRGKIAELDGQRDDDIAQIRAFHASEAESLIGDVQAYCEAHRADLTQNGKKKSVRFPSGQIGWRKRPASILIADAEVALADALRWGLTQFVRTKNSLDKDAMLKEPKVAATVVGVTVVAGAEEFIIKTGA